MEASGRTTLSGDSWRGARKEVAGVVAEQTLETYPRVVARFWAGRESDPGWFDPACPKGCWWEFEVRFTSTEIDVHRGNLFCPHRDAPEVKEATVDLGNGARWVQSHVDMQTRRRGGGRGRSAQARISLSISQVEKLADMAGVKLEEEWPPMDEKPAWDVLVALLAYVNDLMRVFALERRLRYPAKSSEWQMFRTWADEKLAHIKDSVSGDADMERRLRELEKWTAGQDPDRSNLYQAVWDWWTNPPERTPPEAETAELFGW